MFYAEEIFCPLFEQIAWYLSSTFLRCLVLYACQFFLCVFWLAILLSHDISFSFFLLVCVGSYIDSLWMGGTYLSPWSLHRVLSFISVFMNLVCLLLDWTRGGSTENRTIPTYSHRRNKFCRLENVLVTRVTKIVSPRVCMAATRILAVTWGTNWWRTTHRWGWNKYVSCESGARNSTSTAHCGHYSGNRQRTQYCLCLQQRMWEF